MSISVVINVNSWEVALLDRVLSSVNSIADEIVLIDMTSNDEIRIPARKYNAKIYKHERVMWVEPVRNFSIEKATGKWILILDPDEVVTQKLASKLKNLAKNAKADYYRIPRKNIIFGKWVKHSRWWPDFNIRFFKKGHVSWNEIIHSVPMTNGMGSDLLANEENALIHYHYTRVDEYLEKMTRYTTQHSKLLIKDGYKFKWHDLIQKPANEFLSRYFQGEGYKDGIHGLALSGLQALSEFILYLKVWEAEKYKEKTPEIKRVSEIIKETQKDFNYWQADAAVKSTGSILERIRRKLRI